jgi:hypothetical protein
MSKSLLLLVLATSSLLGACASGPQDPATDNPGRVHGDVGLRYQSQGTTGIRPEPATQ